MLFNPIQKWIIVFELLATHPKINLSSCQYRARGYPEPIVTWRREDGDEIVLKDSSGAKQLGKSFDYEFTSVEDECQSLIMSVFSISNWPALLL